MREFETGATRDSSKGKLDYEGFLSPIVLERFAQYMHKHTIQADGELRSSDNWKKGMPAVEYMKSKVRHGIKTWKLWRQEVNYGTDHLENISALEESLCAELFNTMGLLFEILKERV